MYIRFLSNIGECIYLVSFWGYKKYIPYFIQRGGIEEAGCIVGGSQDGYVVVAADPFMTKKALTLNPKP